MSEKEKETGEIEERDGFIAGDQAENNAHNQR